MFIVIALFNLAQYNWSFLGKRPMSVRKARHSINRVEIKLALNFKHRTTLFVYTITSLTRKNDKQIESEYNNNVSQGS